ncbi:hypothetical protein D3C75_969180 [compost metagenome]
MDDPGGCLLDALLHHLATMLGVGQACGQHLAQRRRGPQFLELLAVQLLVLNPAPDLAEQIGRRDPCRTQSPQALGTDADSRDRAENDRQHHPAAGFDQFPHSCQPPQKSGATLAQRRRPAARRRSHFSRQKRDSPRSPRSATRRPSWMRSAPSLAVSCRRAPAAR